MAPEAPIVVYDAPLPWPWRRLPDAREEASCAARVRLDGGGRALDVEIVECPAGLAGMAERKLRHGRWARGHEGEWITGRLVWPAPGDAERLPQPQTWRWRERGGCGVQLVVGSAESVRRLTPGCSFEARVVAVRWEEVPPQLPVLCPITFVATDGVAGHLDLFRCEPRWWALGRGVVQAQTWPSRSDRPEAWSVLVQVDQADVGGDP